MEDSNKSGGESPTTAKPLDFLDSDQEGETKTSVQPKPASAPRPPPKDEAPPPKPPRPMNPREQAETTLKEAFPSIDASVVKAVLAASGGQVEPAFNALLGMTDPDSQREPEPPARPPRPPKPAAQPQHQVDADEMYARQLQEHYAGAGARPSPRQSSDRYNEGLQGSRTGRPGANPNPDDVPWRSFFDDDLPEIRDNIKKGFIETQSTVNKWLTNFKKRIDGEDEDNDFTSQPARPVQNYGEQPGGRRSNDMARRSADMQRYDADPQLIGDDFSKLELKDGEAPPRMSSRPLANPNLFRPASALARKSSSPGGGRKVSFQDGPPEEIKDMYSGSPKPSTTTVQTPQQSVSTAKSSKWQPLSAVEPSPVADNDPFSLGDSDDEKDAKPITLKDDEEDEQVKKATGEAMGDSISGEAKATSPTEAKK